MASANTLPRILYVHLAIKNGERVNAKTIAQRFGGSQRSAYRAVAYLRDQLGAPVAFDSRRNSYYYVDPSYELPTLSLSHSEVMALLVVCQSMLRPLPVPLEHDLERAVSKLKEYLPTSLTEQVSAVLGRLSWSPYPLRNISGEFLDELRQALIDGRTVSIIYYTASRDAVVERDIDPYHLTYRHGDWYVVAYCHRRQRILTFAVSRIRRLSMTARRFEVPPTFDAHRYFEHAFIVDNGGLAERVVLEFDPPEARYVGERSWHSSQRCARLDDGRLRLEFVVALSHELRRWILSYGSHVRVLEPPHLAAQIRDEWSRADGGA